MGNCSKLTFFKNLFQIIFNFMHFCVHFGYFNLVCVTETCCFTLSPYTTILFFFSKTWPSWFAENHFCTLLQSFNKYSHHVLDVVNWGFIENIVKSRIFNAHFFEKHPLILKNGPTWPPVSFKFGSGYFWNQIPCRNVQSSMESFKFAVRYHYPTTLTQKKKVFH